MPFNRDKGCFKKRSQEAMVEREMRLSRGQEAVPVQRTTTSIWGTPPPKAPAKPQSMLKTDIQNAADARAKNWLLQKELARKWERKN